MTPLALLSSLDSPRVAVMYRRGRGPTWLALGLLLASLGASAAPLMAQETQVSVDLSAGALAARLGALGEAREGEEGRFVQLERALAAAETARRHGNLALATRHDRLAEALLRGLELQRRAGTAARRLEQSRAELQAERQAAERARTRRVQAEADLARVREGAESGASATPRETAMPRDTATAATPRDEHAPGSSAGSADAAAATEAPGEDAP